MWPTRARQPDEPEEIPRSAGPAVLTPTDAGRSRADSPPPGERPRGTPQPNRWRRRPAPRQKRTRSLCDPLPTANVPASARLTTPPSASGTAVGAWAREEATRASCCAGFRAAPRRVCGQQRPRARGPCRRPSPFANLPVEWARTAAPCGRAVVRTHKHCPDS
jgi:hypothetical protein